MIEFAVGADVTTEFRKAIAALSEQEWIPLIRKEGGKLRNTGQEWEEVGYVPNWVGYVKKTADYRFLAIREPLKQ